MVTATGRRRISVLGSTGSVGRSTMDLVERNPERFEVVALAGGANADLIAEQAKRTRAGFVAIADGAAWPALKAALAGTGIESAAGAEAVLEAARRDADWTMAAIVGAAGLAPTLTAVRQGRVIALANKESLVCAGDLFVAEARAAGATILPVDSEHNAIFQVFESDRRPGIEKIILTASGGPFRTLSREAMASKGLKDALAHPNWSMGPKISIDSATMMNKGLELIEAHHLFDMPEDRIDILVHPQSVVHSLVAYVDGSVLAQLGSPDMRTPIAYALAWPERMPTPTPRLDLAAVAQLSFEAPDPVRFPALRLAREALRAGGTAPVVLNAANEAAVAAFVERRIGFIEIAAVVEAVLEALPVAPVADIEAVLAVDRRAREEVEHWIGRHRGHAARVASVGAAD
ncbi:1-deoxy-D-xylulose 5-phosphate reductoisomerase [Thalassobaculum fulvum]|uniref:1-deoxy-D-xylulose 5-phosphate reductoisomerase n=1 Tax=Thalassobaculum fulvum TaxID=1633335 RepID=A0A919CQ53_9PROT|nr:1-deoxy-D-xylulose-5-phosphate reductoisomerase [Thalassobaculum fulvum]GHD46750.1 1-deoxy-D-xylulose 5-phosphate reductoisomerase [Thalassobaculum fulvum]